MRMSPLSTLRLGRLLSPFVFLLCAVAAGAAHAESVNDDRPAARDVITGQLFRLHDTPMRQGALSDKELSHVQYDLDSKEKAVVDGLRDFRRLACTSGAAELSNYLLGNPEALRRLREKANAVASLELDYTLAEQFYFDFYSVAGREPNVWQIRLLNLDMLFYRISAPSLAPVSAPAAQKTLLVDWLPKVCERADKFLAAKLTSTFYPIKDRTPEPNPTLAYPDATLGN